MSRTLLRFVATSWIAMLAFITPGRCDPADEYKISEPVAHENLTVYLVHAKTSGGPVPMTLQEALEKKKVRVIETGNVNQLAVENLADEDVFIQAGDIVKGGQQDRALTVSLILPPHSGQIPIAAFCVEAGRWTARGAEDSRTFSVADQTVPSREAKVMMSSPAKTAPRADPIGGSAGLTAEPSGQQAMWNEARRIQQSLSKNLKTTAEDPTSPTSLRLTLDNEKLQRAQNAYITALQPAGEREDDIVGYVFTINGRVNSAAVYSSNGLFRKMWPKLLRAGAVEAIDAGTDAQTAAAKPAAIDDVRNFLKSAETGQVTERKLTPSVTQQTRDRAESLFVETKRSEGPWVARSYLAK